MCVLLMNIGWYLFYGLICLVGCDMVVMIGWCICVWLSMLLICFGFSL